MMLYSHGRKERINFEVDLKNIGNVITYCLICKWIRKGDNEFYDQTFIGNVIIPIYIPEVKSLKEVINDLMTDKHIKFQIFPPTLKTELLDGEFGYDRYQPTQIFIKYLRDLINIDEDDYIYNIIPPEGFKGTYAIHERNEDGQIYKTLFNTTILEKPELIFTNRPKTSIFNRLTSILKIPFQEKFKNGNEYKKL